MITLDHLAFAGSSLADCDRAFAGATGLHLPMGGQHVQMGTHNRLCQLGSDTYLELIAPEAGAEAPNRTRWFGLDHPPEPPAMTAWILRCDNLERALDTARVCGVDLGKAVPFRRDALRWLFSLRDDGAIPLGGAAPMIIEWQSAGAHPSRGMSDLGLRLVDFRIETPFADPLRTLLDALGLVDQPDIQSAEQTRIEARFRRADGTEVRVG